jgi:hypothetical protein
MAAPKFVLTHPDKALLDLIKVTDKITLAKWGIDCAIRVLPYFETKFPNDHRPRQALDTLKTWLHTSVFKMAVIRKAALDSHAAAREVGEDNAARSAARTCGQAVAIAHVKTHAYGPAIYAQQAVFRASRPEFAVEAVARERDWQYQRLFELVNKSK